MRPSATVDGLIMASVDPRLPPGGAIGYGMTGGADALADMTRPQASVVRRRGFASLFPAIAPSPRPGPRWCREPPTAGSPSVSEQAQMQSADLPPPLADGTLAPSQH